MNLKHSVWSLAISLGIFLSVSVSADNYSWGNLAIGGGGFVTAVIPSQTEKNLVYARTDVGGAYRWDEKSKAWIPLMDWIDETQTGYLGVESLALDPKDSSKLYLMVGIAYLNNGKSAILRSNDYGKTFSIVDVTAQFKAHGNGMGRQNGERLQVDPVNSQILYAGSRQQGLFRSSDSGASWKKLESFAVDKTPNENGIAFVNLRANMSDTECASTMVVGVSRYLEQGDNLYLSKDCGKSFGAVQGGPANMMPQKAEFDDKGNIIVVFANGAGPHPNSKVPEPLNRGQLWRIDLKESSWTNITPSDVPGALGAISIDPVNKNRMILSTINVYNFQYQNGAKPANGDQIYITTDAGKTWENIIKRGFVLGNQGVSWIRGHAIHWAGSIAFDPFNSARVWVTSGNGIFRTDNVNAKPINWLFDVKGLEETVPLDALSLKGGAFLSVIGDYDGFSHTTFDQYSPIHEPQIGTTRSIAASASASLIARIADKSPIYISKDKGATWSLLASSKGDGGKVTISADGETIIHTLRDKSESYSTQDEGKTWSKVEGVDFERAKIVADAKNPMVFYTIKNRQLLVSQDKGKTFAVKNTLPMSYRASWVTSIPGREGDLWIPLYDGGLMHSVDGGFTFTNIPSFTYAAAIGYGKAQLDNPYPTLFVWGQIGAVRGLFRSTDAGKSWARINDDKHQYGGPGDGQFLVGDQNQFGVVYMSTAGRGIVYGRPLQAK